MEFKIQRLVDNGEATIGVLFYNDLPMLTTLEPPYKDNETNISCIPIGSYKGVIFNSYRWGRTFQLEVEGRQAIEFHPGNYPTDTHGCILLGTNFSHSNELAIFESAKAFKVFQELTKDVDYIRVNII